MGEHTQKSRRDAQVLYGPALIYQELNTHTQELESALGELFEQEQCRLLSRETLPGGEYRAFGFTSSFGDKEDVTE